MEKEEPKQLNSEDFGLPKIGTKEFNDLASTLFGGKPKQETHKKIAERYYEDEVSINAFINSYKLAQEHLKTNKIWKTKN